MRLYLFGASGAGITTLGQTLAVTLGLPYFDSDDYFWAASEPPFTVKRPATERNELLARDLEQAPSRVLGGSIVGWNQPQLLVADLVVFLWLPAALRLRRLRQREMERYGGTILSNPQRAAQAEAFLRWAAGYDDGSSGGSRTLANHMSWLNWFACPVLELRGDLTVGERLAAITTKIKELGLQ